ncbi:Quinol oxidase subunit 1 [compost metagenome]
MYTYSEETGFGPLNMLSFAGAVGLSIGFLLLVYNIYWSTRYMPRDTTSDPWDGRTLEWATPSPIPAYNFAIVPKVNSLDPFWEAKQKKVSLFEDKITKIHLPNNTGKPFILGVIFFFLGFFLVFSMWIPAIVAGVGVIVMLAAMSFDQDHGFYVSAEEVIATEKKLRGETV